MARRLFMIAAAALLALLAVGAIGTYEYRGTFHGLAEGRYGPGFGTLAEWHHSLFWPSFGHGLFSLVGLAFVLLLVLLAFGLLRRALESGRGTHRGAFGSGVPPELEEWHRRAHQAMPPDAPKA